MFRLGKSLHPGEPCRGYCVQCSHPHKFLSSGRRQKTLFRNFAAPPEVDVDELVDRASSTLEKAREALTDVQRNAAERSNTSAPTFIPSTLTFGAPLSIQEPKPSATPNEPSVQPVKGAAASGSDIPVVKIDQPPRPDLHSVGRSSNSAPPPPPPSSNLDAPWNANVDQAPTMILQRQAVNPAESASIDFAEPNPVSELSFQTQVWYVQA